MSQQLYRQLSNAVLQTHMPNHSECFHKSFIEFLYCDYTSIYELKVLIEHAIPALEKGELDDGRPE